MAGLLIFVVMGSEIIQVPERGIVRITFASLWMLTYCDTLHAIIAGWQCHRKVCRVDLVKFGVTLA